MTLDDFSTKMKNGDATVLLMDKLRPSFKLMSEVWIMQKLFCDNLYLDVLGRAVATNFLGVDLVTASRERELKKLPLVNLFVEAGPDIMTYGFYITKSLISARFNGESEVSFLEKMLADSFYHKDDISFFECLWSFVEMYWHDWQRSIIDKLPEYDYKDSSVDESFKENDTTVVYELYVVLFDYGVIKVGKSKNAEERVRQHSTSANIFGRKVVASFIERSPIISEEDLISFCHKNGTLYAGDEYFTDLKYESVVHFLKVKRAKGYRLADHVPTPHRRLTSEKRSVVV